MQENIKLLIELQGIDSVIIRDKNIIDSMPSRLFSADKAFKEIQAIYDREKQKLNLFEKKKKDKEKAMEKLRTSILNALQNK